MSDRLTFFASGKPEPQGSIRPLPRRGKRLATAGFKDIILTSDNPGLKKWRAIVRAQAVIARMQMQGIGNALRDIRWPTEAVQLELLFVLPRPKRVKPGSEVTHRPDVDKLARAVLDALTGVLYTDDGQVCVLRITKTRAPLVDSSIGVSITAGPLP